METDHCPQCGHPWGSHQRAESMGERCVYMVAYPHRCGCTADNPTRVAEDRIARAAWHGLMGYPAEHTQTGRRD